MSVDTEQQRSCERNFGTPTVVHWVWRGGWRAMAGCDKRASAARGCGAARWYRSWTAGRGLFGDSSKCWSCRLARNGAGDEERRAWALAAAVLCDNVMMALGVTCGGGSQLGLPCCG